MVGSVVATAGAVFGTVVTPPSFTVPESMDPLREGSSSRNGFFSRIRLRFFSVLRRWLCRICSTRSDPAVPIKSPGSLVSPVSGSTTVDGDLHVSVCSSGLCRSKLDQDHEQLSKHGGPELRNPLREENAFRTRTKSS